MYRSASDTSASASSCSPGSVTFPRSISSSAVNLGRYSRNCERACSSSPPMAKSIAESIRSSASFIPSAASTLL